MFLRVLSSFRHTKRIWYSDIVLAFATFWHHILLVHEGFLETALKAPFDVFRVLVREPLCLCPRSINIGNGES